MQTVPLGRSSLRGTRLAYGGWRLAGTWDPAAVTPAGEAAGRQAVEAAFEAGYTVFDLADIYCHGRCESIFGQVLREHPGWRERMIVVTKCGIRRPGDVPGAPYRYDFSAAYIERSCEESLRRLGLETIDLFLLHRPDYLMDPAEVAGAFERLRAAGKARYFGVSNFTPSRLTALQSACDLPLVANQVEISLAQLAAFEDGTLDQCLADRILPMAWSPLAGGKLGAGAHHVLPSQEGYRPDAVNAVLDELARGRGVTRTAVALAWLLKHPAGIMPVVGSIEPARIRDAVTADTVELSREDWYRLLAAARPTPLP